MSTAGGDLPSTTRKGLAAVRSNVFAIDLHTHTRFFHGRKRLGDVFDKFGVRALAATARRRGLDALALTNHDYYTPFRSRDPVLLPGIEITTSKGHLLVVGPDPPKRTKPGALSPTAAVELAHDHDCAAILAHPFRNSTLRTLDVEYDAIEVNGKQIENREQVAHIASERGIPIVGGSDAHLPFEVGRAFTVVDAPDPTPEAVVAAIKDGRVRAQTARTGLDRVLEPVYDEIHRRKGHTRT